MLGAGSLRCGTVLTPDTDSEVGELCDEAASHHLRGALTVGAVRSGLALVPFVAARSARAPRGPFWGWANAWVAVAALTLLWLGWAYEYSPRRETFNL